MKKSPLTLIIIAVAVLGCVVKKAPEEEKQVKNEFSYDEPKEIRKAIEKLKDKDEASRCRTVEKLSRKVGLDRIIPLLIQSLKDEDQHLHFGASYALVKLTGENFGEDHKKWQRWWLKNKDKFRKN